MSIAEAAKKKAAELRAKKANGSKPTEKKIAAAPKKAAKKSSGKEKKGEAKPRANSKTAQILAMLKGGSTREQIRKKYDMEKVSDVSWYISKLKRVGRLPESFNAKD